MRSPSWPDPLWGQCKCGATLTVDHLRNHCPLRPQQARYDAGIELPTDNEWRALVRRAHAGRLDTTHVAELGYN